MTSDLSLSLYLLQAQRLAKDHQKLCFVAENNHQAQWLFELLSQSRSDVFCFPDWEVLPYDTLSPALDVAAERARTLYRLSQEKSFVVITSAHSIAYRLPEKRFYEQQCFRFKVNTELAREDLINLLSTHSYTRVDEVREPMEFAIRGALIDFYPPFAAQPLRLEWDFNHIEKIRFFDPITQRSVKELSEIEFFPSYEYPVDKDSIVDFAHKAAELWGAKNPIAQQLRQGKIPPGFLFFSPLWMGPKKYRFYDYLPRDAVLSLHPKVFHSLEELKDQADKAYEETTWRYGFLTFKPEQILADFTLPEEICHKSPSSEEWEVYQLHTSGPWEELKSQIPSSNKRWIFTFESYSRSQILVPKIQALLPDSMIECATLEESLAKTDLPYVFTLAPLQEAVHHISLGIVIIPEAWLYQETVRVRSRRTGVSRSKRSRQALELATGSLVVHRHHGLGRYKGLTTLTFDNFEQELIELEFQQSQKLYVPLTDIILLTPYYALEQQNIELALLGSPRWKKQLQNAQKAIEDQAAALLAIHAARAKSQGEAFEVNADYYEFAASFPFEETPDQKQAIAEVLVDLQSPIPMDRLVCGDVGFGKTEVALRAIFIALGAGHQVAFLAPTTLLSQQHYETLLERFENWPYKIALLTRHTASATEVLRQLAAGEIDCVVGTHKLLQPTVEFKKLGLIVVDEEHRFGVRHKEALKKWRGSVNILTLTATPIPRTLSMSFQGLRDLSLIASPPSQRRSIQTMISVYDLRVIEQALSRELFRGGQVYYLCNDIDKHPDVVVKLKNLFPAARIESLHGQLNEREMERRMNQFYHQRLDILVGTTIIETGIDVPGANTIIIDNAHCFGLAQLHQIRGRVGRSHQQAYAYLMIPMPKEHLSETARSRLELLVQYQDLGSGFQLATHDLEIRGAGEILGDKQSGHILDLGIDLYRQILEEACRALDSNQKIKKEKSIEFLIDRAFSVDPYQIPDPSMRLRIYHHFEQLDTIESWYQECASFEDRFGVMTPRTQEWAQSHRFRILAESWQWRQFKWRKKQPLLIEFAPKGTEGSCSEPAIEQFVQDHMRYVSIKGPRAISLAIPPEAEVNIVALLSRFFDRLEDDIRVKSSLLWACEKS